MNSYNKDFLTDTAMNANITGPAMEVHFMYVFSITAKVTGTPTGVIHLEVSNDHWDCNPTYVPGNFNTLSDSTFTLTSAGLTTWNYNGAGFNYVRVVYVDGSSGVSTATLTVTMNAKG